MRGAHIEERAKKSGERRKKTKTQEDVSSHPLLMLKVTMACKWLEGHREGLELKCYLSKGPWQFGFALIEGCQTLRRYM